MSLRTKLILSYVAVILLTLLIVGAGLLLALRNYGQQLTALRLADAIGPTAVQARALWRQGSTPGQIATEIQDQLGNADWRVLIVNDAGQILADSSGDLTGRRLRQNFNPPPKPLQRAFTGRQVFTGRTLLYIGIVIGERDGSRAFILLASFVRPFLTTFAELIPLLAIGGGAALIVSILIALLLARSISQPLARLTRATEQVARGNYAQTIAAEGTDEVGRLAASFSTMAQAVQASQKM
jgi:HAMP domain-containing protein